MRISPRQAIIGGVGVIAVSAGVFGLSLRRAVDEPPLVGAAVYDDSEVCLLKDISFLPGDQDGCFARSALAQWESTPLVDPERGALALSMTHPTDASRDVAVCTTCREFREYRFDGWYALSSRDMRREAFFVRACGVIEMLRYAQAADQSYFADDGLEAGEAASLAAEHLLQLGDDPAIAPGNPEIDRIGPSSWRVVAGGQTVRIEEIAMADFDTDGRAEILAFLTAGPTDATARVFDVVLLEKDSADAGVSLSPVEFREKSRLKKRA